MEGLRGLAVSFVFFVHYCSLIAPYLAGDMLAFSRRLSIVGNAGVDLFFVLSGYLIYGGLIRAKRPFFGFMTRRIQRLYPVFVVVLSVYLVLSLLLPSESKLPDGVWNQVLFIGENFLLLPGIFSIRPIITVAWSLSYEMFFYLTIPLLIGAMRLRSWSARTRILLCLAFVIAGEAIGLPHPRMGMFACGIVLADLLPIVERSGRTRFGLDFAALATVPVCGLILLLQISDRANFAALFVTCLLLCGAALAHRGVIARIFVVKPLRWLGNMSYSFYLLHALMLKMFFFAVPHIPGTGRLGNSAFWIFLPPSIALALIGSALLFLWVERPFSIMPAKSAHEKPVGTIGFDLPTPVPEERGC